MSNRRTSDQSGAEGAWETGAFGRFFSLFSETDRSRLLRLLLAIVLMAIFQVVGIASVLPFLELAANPAAAYEGRGAWLLSALKLTDPRQALVAMGIAVVGLLLLANAASAWLILQRQRISWSVAHHLSMRLVKGYAALPYSFFLVNNSADLIRKNINDVNGIVNGVILAGSTLLTNLLVSALIMALLAAVEPLVTLAAGGLLLVLFGAVSIFRRRYLSDLGRRQVRINRRRFETFVDLVGGIKTVKTDGAHAFFVARFAKASEEFSLLNPKLQFAAAVPRFVAEVVVFGGVVLVTIWLVTTETAVADTLPSLVLYAVAAYRLLPALSGAYASYTSVVSSLPAVDNIFADLNVPADVSTTRQTPLIFEQRIDVGQVSFRYDDVNPLVLHGVDLSIAKGEKVAFVGPSGSGKSTLADIVMGLFSPVSGEVRIDGVPLDGSNTENWRARVAYVPQSVFLYDATFEQNIAFGRDRADPERLARACDWAQLGGLVDTLPNGVATMLGERGVRLSGGERQRIGLARAFYRQPEVLVLDEATSALDNRTEAAVIEAIERNLPQATILMIAHRILTVKNCDRLFVMDRGRILAAGSFAELIRSNELFQDLARIS